VCQVEFDRATTKDNRGNMADDKSGSRQGRREIPPRVKIDDQGRWTLVPPHCVFELEPDLADIEMLMKEGDFEAARDGALYLLEECQDMTAAHLLLGKIAEKEIKDPNIARAHYAYVFEITLKWLGRNSLGVMNGGQKINRISLEAAEGLKRVLEKRGDRQKAEQVARHIAAWKGHSEPSRTLPPRPSGAQMPRRPAGPVSPNRPGGSSTPARNSGSEFSPRRPLDGNQPERRPKMRLPERNRPGDEPRKSDD
jgi:hypothetical protein